MRIARLLHAARPAALATLFLTAAATLTAHAAGEASYPNGRSGDRRRLRPAAATTCSRAWSAQKLAEIIGQTVIIENKPGAGGRIAVEYVENQPADGYTLMVAASGQMAIAAAIYPKLRYHPTRDFIPLTMIANFPLILAGPIGRQDQDGQGARRLRQGRTPTSRTTRRLRRRSRSRPSCSSSRPACPGSGSPTRAATR